MGKYRIPIRLYKRHDLDLIYLHLHPEFSLPKAMKVALMGFVRHENFRINVPLPIADKELDFKKFPKKPILFFIYLKEDEDDDLIDFIKNMPDGYRNSLVKNVFRNYLASPNLYGYYISKEDAVNSHKQIKSNEVDYNQLSISDRYNYFTHQSTYNMVDILKSKKKNKKKKLNTANIPIEELPEAILTDKIHDEEYLKQFDDKETKKSKLSNKKQDIPAKNTNTTIQTTTKESQHQSEEAEDMDFFSDIEAMINSL